MHRAPLLDLLEGYAATYPHEKETVERFRDFVAGNVDCFQRSLLEGHLTGSAWIVDGRGERVLLTHHRKLDRWLQPGGHADGESDLLSVARKEAWEETGLEGLEVVGEGIFDLDIHTIPPCGEVPGHLHYDARFLLRDSGEGKFVVSEESHDLAWVEIGVLESFTREESMLRMRDKAHGLHLRTA